MTDTRRKHLPKSQPTRTRTCREFLEQWAPRLRAMTESAELDYSFRDDAITITDIRIPSAQRTGVLYTRHEVEDYADKAPGDFEFRLDAFLNKAPPVVHR